MVRSSCTHLLGLLLVCSLVPLAQAQTPFIQSTASSVSMNPYLFGEGPSNVHSFMIQGANFTSVDVSIVAPFPFEVASDYNGPWSSSVQLQGYTGATTVLYVRLPADLDPGPFSGSLTITSPQTETIAVHLVGSVMEIPYGFEAAHFVYTQDFADEPRFGYSLIIQNKLGVDVRLKSLILSFIGEQWAQSGDAESLNFSYMISDRPFVEPSEQTWYTNTALDLHTTHIGVPGPLNGNDPANQTMIDGQSVSETGMLPWLHYITFKWSHSASETALLGLDDLRLSFDTYSVTITNAPGEILMSSPATETGYSDLFKNVWTRGFEGANEQFSDAPNLRHYHPAEGFTPISFLSNYFGSADGFAYTHLNDDDNDGQPNTAPTVLTVTGPENPSPTYFLAGWHNTTNYMLDGVAWEFWVMGNPFDTAIDWDLLGKQADLAPVVWVWDPFTSSYKSWNGSSGDLTNGVIPAFQGFWTASKGPYNMITFLDAHRVPGNQFYGKEPETESMRFAIRGRQGRFESTAWVEFTETGLVGHDKWDAISMTPRSDSYIHVGTRMNGISYDINTLPLNTEPFELPLHIKSSAGGMVDLSVVAFNLPEGWDVQLQDVQTEQIHSFGPDFSLSLQVPAYVQNPMGPPVPQFRFIVEPPPTSSVDGQRETMDGFRLNPAYPNPFNPTTVIGYQISVFGQTRLAVYDLLGREVAVLVDGVMPAGSHQAIFTAAGLGSGIYVVRLESDGRVETQRVTLLK